MKYNTTLLAALLLLLHFAVSATATAATMTATSIAADGEAWWGYWNSGLGADLTTTLSGGQTNCYIRLVAPNDLLTGTRLHGVRIYLSDKTAVTAVKAWASVGTVNWTTALPDRQQKDADMADVKDTSHDGQPTEVRFDAPVDLLPAGNRYASMYVGVLISVDAALAAEHPCQVLSATLDRAVPYSCFIADADRSASLGPLALQLLVSGGQLKSAAVSPQPTEQPVLLAASPATLHLNMRNESVQPVTSIDYTVSIGAETLATTHADLDKPVDELGADFSVSVPVNMPAEAALHDLTVSVTGVNGADNQSAAPQATTPQLLLQQYGTKHVVMEEYTGTWCPNCPRGDVALHLLNELFADRFIGISVHNDDPMTVTAYDRSPAKMRFLDGYPSCAIDRLISCDPYQGLNLYVKAFQTDQLVAYELGQQTEADVAVQAAWDADGHTVTAEAATTFWYSAATGRYQLAFVLIADGLTGTTKAWDQYNTYSGGTGWDEPMDAVTQGDRFLHGPYDHVAIDVAGIDNGLPGSISQPIVCGEVQAFSQQFDTAGNELVQHPDRLSVAVLLIDATTGQIVNAAKAPVTGSGEQDAIAAPTATAAATTRYYQVDGRPSTHPVGRKGLVIERRPDGTAKVVLSR